MIKPLVFVRCVSKKFSKTVLEPQHSDNQLGKLGLIERGRYPGRMGMERKSKEASGCAGTPGFSP